MTAPEQYTVVTSDDLGKFEDRINHLLSEGWLPQGGVATSRLAPNGEAGLHLQWSQAMVLSSRPIALAGDEDSEEDPLELLSESRPTTSTPARTVSLPDAPEAPIQSVEATQHERSR